MKPSKLSTKSNLLGEVMKLSDNFKNLKKRDHSSSFDDLGEWLDQNSKQPNTMKNIYKIAASFIFATLILIACTVPVEQEEEIGYMIKGIAETESVNLKSKLAEIPGLKISQLSINDIIFEQEETEFEKKETQEKSASYFSEVIMVLPEANYDAAVDNKSKLMAAFDFESIEILPIEEKVERTFFDSALHTLELKVDKSLTDEKVAARINTFLHENSNAKGDAKILIDENGNRFVVLEVGMDKNAVYTTKKSIEELVNDLTPEENRFIMEEMTNEEVMELKEKEVQKAKKLKEASENK